MTKPRNRDANRQSADAAPHWFAAVAGYALMVAVAVGIFFVVRHFGQGMSSAVARTATIAPSEKAPAESSHLLPVLVALAAVIALGQVLARVCSLVGQPPVIGEVLAGILLGPSLLGEHVSAMILPPSAAQYLSLVAQIGVILYMFLVGLELNAERLRSRAHIAALVSVSGIVVPFALGVTLSLSLYPRLSSAEVPFTSFALFMGVAMSITAFPVLARILTDQGMAKSELGVLALSCAAVDDATAWCLLALVAGVARAQHPGEGAPSEGMNVAVCAIGYVAVMFGLVRPLARRLVLRWDSAHLPRSAVALVFLGLLLSALATEWIGIHALFGAFLFGVVIPHDSAVAKAFTQQLQHITTVLLLPAFFALTGMHTRIDLLSGTEQWLICGAIIAVATLGKFGGTVAAARWTGLKWRESAALGTLMNTRGLMELIVLNVGRELHVIPPSLFAMMVVMALVTTIATSPIVRRLVPA